MTRSTRLTTVALVALIGLAGVSPLAGCKKKKAPPPPPPPPQVKVDPFDGLKTDPRVQFPEERAPDSPEMAQAIADVANAFATGNAAELRALLNPTSTPEITYLLDSGEWAEATRGIEVVRVCALEKTAADGLIRIGLGIQDANGAYLLALAGAPVDGGGWIFGGLPVEWRTGTVASEFDNAKLTPPTLASAAEDYMPPAPVKEEEENRIDDSDRTRPGGFTKPGIF